MKIYAVTEFDKPFVYLTTGLAFKALGDILGCEAIVSDYPVWGHRKLEKDSGNDAVVLFEAAYLDYVKMSTKELRSFFPNAKFVALGSDTTYYVTNKKGFQFDSPLEVDLFLDSMDHVCEDYAKLGIKTDSWMWTTSGENLRQVTEFTKNNPAEKDNDFVSVLAPWTITREGSYRKAMVDYLRARGYTFEQGGGNGHMDKDVEKIYRTYVRSRFTLGTTSHDNPTIRGMKGWRDWIGPHLGAALIYDDHPDVLRKYHNNGLVPVYPYGDFEKICVLADELKANSRLFDALLERQRQWAEANTIERQLASLLIKHGIA